MKKVRNSQLFTEKSVYLNLGFQRKERDHLRRSQETVNLILSLENSRNLLASDCNFRLWHRCFLVNFEKFLRTPFFIEHFRWLLPHMLLTCQIVNRGSMCQWPLIRPWIWHEKKSSLSKVFFHFSDMLIKQCYVLWIFLSLVSSFDHLSAIEIFNLNIIYVILSKTFGIRLDLVVLENCARMWNLDIKSRETNRLNLL